MVQYIQALDEGLIARSVLDHSVARCLTACPQIHCWREDGAGAVDVLHGHTGPVTAIVAVEESGTLFSAGPDGIRRWCTATGMS